MKLVCALITIAVGAVIVTSPVLADDPQPESNLDSLLSTVVATPQLEYGWPFDLNVEPIVIPDGPGLAELKLLVCKNIECENLTISVETERIKLVGQESWPFTAGLKDTVYYDLQFEVLPDDTGIVWVKAAGDCERRHQIRFSFVSYDDTTRYFPTDARTSRSTWEKNRNKRMEEAAEREIERRRKERDLHPYRGSFRTFPADTPFVESQVSFTRPTLRPGPLTLGLGVTCYPATDELRVKVEPEGLTYTGDTVWVDSLEAGEVKWYDLQLEIPPNDTTYLTITVSGWGKERIHRLAFPAAKDTLEIRTRDVPNKESDTLGPVAHPLAVGAVVYTQRVTSQPHHPRDTL
jgi:hypothetical protein